MAANQKALTQRTSDLYLDAGIRNHRNLPGEILALFYQDTVGLFDVAA